MKYLHTMVRVTDVDASLKFYVDALLFDMFPHTEHFEVLVLLERLGVNSSAATS